MKYQAIFLSFLLCCVSFSCVAQFGFVADKNTKQIDIPFEYENNFIVVEVTLNRTFPLRMIFDTGAEHTILCQKSITDLLKVNYEKTFDLLGADLKTPLKSYLAKNITIETNEGSVFANNQNILVLDQDYFRLEACVGTKIQGILGADLFNNYVLKINYQKKMITLFEPNTFEAPRDYEVFPIQISQGKPFISPIITLDNGQSLLTTILIDSGASLSFLLYAHTHPSLVMPQRYIQGRLGMGLGGNIMGYTGRIEKLSFSENIFFDQLLVDFQDFTQGSDSLKVVGRNGILGNDILNRFVVIIDYIHSKAYLKPTYAYNKPFEYDKSGMLMMASGENLNRFYVQHIVPDSPAELADIHVDDRLMSINNISTKLMNLESLCSRFRKKEGKRYRLVIYRNGEYLEKYLTLKVLI